MSRAVFTEESRMSKCVFRTNLRHQPVSEALLCVEGSDLFYCPAARTVEECVQSLLAHDEVCLGSSDKREVMQGPRVVGYIRIVNACG
jgi:hypothetical protein